MGSVRSDHEAAARCPQAAATSRARSAPAPRPRLSRADLLLPARPRPAPRRCARPPAARRAGPAREGHPEGRAPRGPRCTAAPGVGSPAVPPAAGRELGGDLGGSHPRQVAAASPGDLPHSSLSGPPERGGSEGAAGGGGGRGRMSMSIYFSYSKCH